MLVLVCASTTEENAIIVTEFYRVIEKDRRDLKPLLIKKYWTDLHVLRLKMFRRVQSLRLTLINL